MLQLLLCFSSNYSGIDYEFLFMYFFDYFFLFIFLNLETAMGRRIYAQSDSESEYVKAVYG